ncbi:MAG: Fe-S protein assembly co-chaperone HscB [Bacteroidota bacterium]
MENYFELFDIPVQLQVDTRALRPTFFALSRQYHPDFFVNRPPEEQQAALEKTALINKAWKTFQQPDELLRYVLEINGAWTSGEKYELSPDFLMEVMEINEAMMDLEGDDKMKIQKQIETLQSGMQEPVADYFSEIPFVITPDKLALLKEYYYRKKYLDRITRQSL